MKGLQNNNAYASSSSQHPHLIGFIVLSVFLICAFVLSSCSSVASAAQTTPVAQATHTSTSTTTTSYPIKVYFSKSPVSLQTDFGAVYPVNRISPTIAVATFSIQLLIAGPTLSERNAGYFSELNAMLSGASSCSGSLPTGGPDFTLALDMRGTHPQAGTATLKFCRAINSPGIGADARVKAEIQATLMQFSNIKQVVILTQNGHCFADETGKDLCLK